jgi:hypothetical protein
MAGNKTTRMSKRRALLCVMLAALLSAPLLSAGISVEQRGQPIQILAFAGSSPTILMNRGGPRVGHTVVASPFILLPLQSPAPDRGRSVRAVENPCPQSRCAAKMQSGRSPPVAIS